MSICKLCGTETIYDEYAGTHYCEKCCEILDDSQVYEESDEVMNETVEYNGEHLSVPSLVFLNILMWIPILNIFVAFWINNSDAKSEYKKQFGTKILIDIIVMLCLLVLLVPWIYNRKKLVYENAHKVVMWCEDIFMSQGEDMDLPTFDSADYLELLAQQSKDLPTYTDAIAPNENHRIFNGCILTGKSATNMIAGMDTTAIVLVQTKEIARRYSKDTYRNVGRLISGAEYNVRAENYMYEGELPVIADYYTNDYGEEISVPLDDLFNSKYIYYLNPDKYYECTILCNDLEEVTGFVLKEVSLK